MKSRFRPCAVPFTVLFALSCWSGNIWSEDPPVSSDVSRAAQHSEEALPGSEARVTIPGPLRSFLRMAAISQKASPEEVLPLLARKVAMEGYDRKGKPGRPTEYLILLKRYVEQARELYSLAGRDGVIRVASCADVDQLLAVLGYGLQHDCGPSASVGVADPERAFVTIDSGFPLTDLEETLRAGGSFVHPFPASQVPVLFGEDVWKANDRTNKGAKDILDRLLRDPALSRLYWAMTQIDASTATFLLKSIGLERLITLAPVLDFYGSQLCIRSGQVVVPGGTGAASSWKNLVGVGPDSAKEFLTRLLTKDGGWLAAYLDALSRASPTQQAYLTEPHRLRRFYEALRGRTASPGAADSVFRPNPGLALLVTRLQLEANGQPHVPGSLDVWKEIFREKWDSRVVRELAKHYSGCNSSEQLLEGMFAFSRAYSEAGPLQIYLALSEIDRRRTMDQRLSPETARLLAEKFPGFSSYYPIFTEFGALNNTSITGFVKTAEAVEGIRNRVLRADALGILQANLGLWQILARQGQIPTATWNDSWQQVINPFSAIVSPSQLFDVARASLGELFRAAGTKSQPSQDEIVALLAGPEQTSAEGQKVKQELANKMRSAFEAQRLVSLDTLFALGDGLSQAAQGKAAGGRLLGLAGELREFRMPKPLFTSGERVEWTPGRNRNSHLQLEQATDLTASIKSSRSPGELAVVRGRLVPFLRDSLVGLNYAYYAPPAAQMLYNNPLFVRAHDFTGEEVIMGGEPDWKTPSLFGRGWTASGGTHLTGSLADLPYVLAQVEQDFIVPENVQSLIWEDLVPSLVTSAVLPRWWRVTRNELHAVTLYQRFGEELLAAAANDAQSRQRAMTILSDRLPPRRFEQVEEDLQAKHVDEALARLTPSECFYLAAEYRQRFPKEPTNWSKAGPDLERLAQRDPEAVSWGRLSQAFGVPHPAFAQTYARELLAVKPFPTFIGYSSRLLAESWESTNLYWARLADEMGYPPVMLNRLVPELTHRMVEKIFATDLEDWPALLRALRETGEEFRLGKIASIPTTSVASGL